MRMEHSIRNTAVALIGQLFSFLLAFVARTVFIYTLGEQYLSINGLFTSILYLLSFAELGIGTAIIYALYKPLAEKDELKIAALMNLYARVYHIIGCIIAVLGIALLPFLDWIIGELPHVQHITLIYLMFLFNSVASYFFVYKRSLLIANQLDSISTMNQIIFLVIQYTLQMILLWLTGNYLLYLGVQLLCVFASNVMISRRANREFPFLKQYPKAKVDQETRSSIKRNVMAMVFHQFGSVAVTGTDNLLIAWVNIILVGLYSNYTMIIQAISTILQRIFQAVTASVGNLIAQEDKEKQYQIYHNIFFMNFWLYGFCTISLVALIDPFIQIWIGKNYILSPWATILIALNFFLYGMRQTNLMYINTYGLFWPIRIKPFVEGIINLSASLFFMLILDMGLYGVLLGTTVSTLSTNFWWEPYIIYKHGFQRDMKGYFIRFGGYVVVLGFATGFTLAVGSLYSTEGWGNLLYRTALCIIIPNLIFFLAFFRLPQFRYFMDIAKRMLQSPLNRLKR